MKKYLVFGVFKNMETKDQTFMSVVASVPDDAKLTSRKAAFYAFLPDIEKAARELEIEDGRVYDFLLCSFSRLDDDNA